MKEGAVSVEKRAKKRAYTSYSVFGRHAPREPKVYIFCAVVEPTIPKKYFLFLSIPRPPPYPNTLSPRTLLSATSTEEV